MQTHDNTELHILNTIGNQTNFKLGSNNKHAVQKFFIYSSGY